MTTDPTTRLDHANPAPELSPACYAQTTCLSPYPVASIAYLADLGIGRLWRGGIPGLAWESEGVAWAGQREVYSSRIFA